MVGDKKLKCTDFGASTVHPPLRVAMHPKFSKYFYRACKKDVCGDGEAHEEKNYCGKGSCNLVGCNCKGGCIDGQPLDSFIINHGADVEPIGPDVFETIDKALVI